MGERLSDARLAVLMSHAENFGELLIGPSNLAALVAECQEFRSPLVRAQIAFAEAYMTPGVTANAWDEAIANLRAALANTKEREG